MPRSTLGHAKAAIAVISKSAMGNPEVGEPSGNAGLVRFPEEMPTSRD